jgi:hypothetical protein
MFCHLFQVKITDMHMRDTVESMHPGDPQCSPSSAVMAEALTALVRSLHRSDTWRESINSIILTRLQFVGKLTNVLSVAEPDSTVSNDIRQKTEKHSESNSSLVITDIGVSSKRKAECGG